MADRPILFSAPMVCALLAGTKTQTRRPLRRQFAADAEVAEVPATTPEGFLTSGHSGRWWDDASADIDAAIRCPYGVPGDRLWVRESLKAVYDERELIVDYAYAADGAKVPRDPTLDRPFSDGFAFAHLARPGGVPSIHMPRWASRITLNVTGVRVERLQAISEADATAEGTPNSLHLGGGRFAAENYAHLWDTINGEGAWAANPWVWVVEFERAKA